MQKSCSRKYFAIPPQIAFAILTRSNQSNIIFTSQCDNYTTQISNPFNGNASHAYFLISVSTHPMQSQFDNGKITVTCTDGSKDSLILKKPENWWPI